MRAVVETELPDNVKLLLKHADAAGFYTVATVTAESLVVRGRHPGRQARFVATWLPNGDAWKPDGGYWWSTEHRVRIKGYRVEQATTADGKITKSKTIAKHYPADDTWHVYTSERATPVPVNVTGLTKLIKTPGLLVTQI